MFAFLFSLGLLGLLDAAAFGQTRFYVGTYTKSGRSEGIYVGTLDAATGQLGPLTLAAAAADPSFLALTPDGRFLYAALESEDQVAAFQVGAGGVLTPLNARPSGGGGPCHVSVDGAGGHLLAANYGGGTVAAFPIGADGRLGERSGWFPFHGSGPDPKRQDKPHAHSIYVDRENRFAYACDLGTDLVSIFKFDPAHGTLVRGHPASASAPPGAGPRHLAWSADGRFLYAVNEMGISVTTFARDPADGGLTPLETVPLPVADGAGGVNGAEIVVHPSGRWLYVSTRGNDALVLLALAPDGRASVREAFPAGVKGPRSFAVDPSGRWLIAAGQGDDRIAVHAVDPATGALRPTGIAAEIGSPVCVLFAPGSP